jgi:hypothetical protein
MLTATPEGTLANTPTPTDTTRPTPSRSAAASQTPTATPTPTVTHTIGNACVGDCDSSGDVAVNELITLVTIDLGSAEPSACANGIPSGSSVDITLIIKAVGYALTNCPTP